MSDERRYSEREVAEIVRLATEGKGEPASSGMTLREIQAVVAELGLDPEKVRDAANHVDAGLPEVNENGSQIEFLRTFDGELDDAGWEEILLKIRRHSGTSGEVTQRGTTREWHSTMGGLEEYHLSATVKNGKTRVRMTHDIAGVAAITWILAVLPLLLGPVIILAKSAKSGIDMTIPYIVSALIVFAVVLAAHLSNRRQKRRSRSLDKLIAEFESSVTNDSVAAPAAARSEADDLRLHLGQAE